MYTFCKKYIYLNWFSDGYEIMNVLLTLFRVKTLAKLIVSPTIFPDYFKQSVVGLKWYFYRFEFDVPKLPFIGISFIEICNNYHDTGVDFYFYLQEGRTQVSCRLQLGYSEIKYHLHIGMWEVLFQDLLLANNQWVTYSKLSLGQSLSWDF